MCHFGTFWHTMCHLTSQVPVRKTNCVSLIHHSGYSFHPNTTISLVQDCGRAGNSKTCLSSTFHSNLFSLSLQDADADVRRECVLKLLIIYLGECVEDLIKEYTVCPNLFCLSMIRCNFNNPGGSLTALPLDVVVNHQLFTYTFCPKFYLRCPRKMKPSKS